MTTSGKFIVTSITLLVHLFATCWLVLMLREWQNTTSESLSSWQTAYQIVEFDLFSMLPASLAAIVSAGTLILISNLRIRWLWYVQVALCLIGIVLAFWILLSVVFGEGFISIFNFDFFDLLEEFSMMDGDNQRQELKRVQTAFRDFFIPVIAWFSGGLAALLSVGKG